MRLSYLTDLPAPKALFIQFLAFALVAAFLFFLRSQGVPEINVLLAAIAQGLIAAAISWRRLPRWWSAIQFVFPIALILGLGLHLPPILFLVGFLILLGFYWAVAVTRVPLYLSGVAVWQSVAEQLPQDKSVRFIDIGSGIGGILFHLEGLRPDCHFTGVEMAPLPWLVSWVRSCLRRSSCRLVRGDYNDIDFSKYDVVFAYLSPWVMGSLWKKVQSEMRPGTLMLSCEFIVPDKEPDLIIQPEESKSVLYGWNM